jgi:hypothetical protein
MYLDDNRKYFFIHVMKTGGTSFSDIIAANFRASDRYPDAYINTDTSVMERLEAYLYVPDFVSRVNAMQGGSRMVSGHVPYSVRSLFNDPYIAMTILRNPIERTISYLTHCKRYHPEHQHLDIEQIYEDPWFHATFISNYQTKIFSMSAQEALVEDRFVTNAVRLPPRKELGSGENFSEEVKLLQKNSPGRLTMECFAASTGVINIDQRRLKIAMDNLSDVEVVGVTEHYDRFLRQLVDRYGWDIKSIPHRHAGNREHVSQAFQRRIARDNAFDIELHEYAKSIAS